MAEELYSFERHDGVRMPWNFWPRSKVEALKCVLPFSVLYTPLKQTQNTQEPLQYPPVVCKDCGAAVNPYAVVDYGTKMWVCPHCTTRNYFPQQYSDISPENMPAELFPECTTVEHLLPSAAQYPPIYMFIVDTAVSEEELTACKDTLMQALELMPENALVGLVSFGTHVHVHELQPSAMSKVYVFRGTGDFSPGTVATQLGFRSMARSQQQGAGGPYEGILATKFLVSLEDADLQITTALENLQPDAYPPASDHRKSRCTGAAVQVAAGLAASGLPEGLCPVRLMLFVGGPCTEGKGAMVAKELSKEIRSHKDLDKDACEFWRPAVAFYENIAATLVAHSHTLDVFACALEQSGLAEMKPAVQSTGGLVVQTDTFLNPMFKDSLTRVFAKPGDAGFAGRCSCATLEVFCSRDVKLQGMLGCGASLQKGGASVSTTVVGAGRSSAFRVPALDQNSTLCLFFEITADSKAADKARSPSEVFHLQFATKYLHWDGTWRKRVTTLARRWVSGANPHDVIVGFDQEAAAVMMARYCTWKMETEEDFDATRWIDRSLIRLCQRFGQYTKEEANTFKLLHEMTYYPGFMFHLRRSQFVQVFGNSPDETAFARLMLFKEHTQHAIMMVQPQLLSYGLGEEAPQMALVDVGSIVPDRILFLDTYFYVVVHHGNTIARWRAEGYQNNPEHAAFAEMLRQPQERATEIMRSRFPVPRVVDSDNFTVAGRSQSRFLLVKLNPSSTHSSNSGPGEVIFTDDVSLDIFIDHLKTLSVQS